ncbi:MAG: SDR family oxidoreductase [Alphaproteobacteria bacterium]|nr:SDR family oxidoreductase [Alphaproteobacteria bacterium]
MQLEGKSAIVTGSSSGIGRAAALALANAGADVVVNGNSKMEAAEEVAHEIEGLGRKSLAVQADVSNAQDVDRLVTQAVETLGKVDILFANAGIFHMGMIEDHTPDMWLQTLNVNLTGQFLACQRVIPEMKKLGKGKIVNNGSIFGSQGVMGCIAYGVSKMGVHGMTRCMAAELAPHKINVNAVAPGCVVTEIADDFFKVMGNGDMEAGKQEVAKSYPIGRLGKPDDIGNMVAYLASDAADFITGQIMFVDGGYSVP